MLDYVAQAKIKIKDFKKLKYTTEYFGGLQFLVNQKSAIANVANNTHTTLGICSVLIKFIINILMGYAMNALKLKSQIFVIWELKFPNLCNF